MRRMLLVFTPAMVLALMMLAMALPAFAGGADDDEDKDNESASGAPTRNGQIVFRRYLDPDQTKGVLFAMNPDGSHVSQITHPPKGLARRCAGVVSRWEESGLPATENRREHEPHHGPQCRYRRCARGYTLRTRSRVPQGGSSFLWEVRGGLPTH